MRQLYWVAFLTIVRKEIIRFSRLWVQTLIPPVITMTLYFLIFGQLIGNRIGTMQGYDYMQFIAPGLIMMSVITNAYGNTVSSFFGAKFQQNIEEIIVAPVPCFVIILGFVIGGVCRGVTVGALVTLVAAIFTDITIYNLPVIIVTVIMTAVLFALGGLLNALFAKTFDDITMIPTFVLTPLTYLGGVFYSLELLNEFWQSVSYLNPLVYMITTFRYGFLGIEDIDWGYSLGLISLFIVIFYSWTHILLSRGIGLKE